jgi:transcriptional regulator with XRE-family HTH domain
MRYRILLTHARQRAGLSQRDVADRTGLPQSTIARIESGRTVPRADTLERLLAACNAELDTCPLSGLGIDRSAMRELLRLTPAERAQLAVDEARNLAMLPAPRRV